MSVLDTATLISLLREKVAQYDQEAALIYNGAQFTTIPPFSGTGCDTCQNDENCLTCLESNGSPCYEQDEMCPISIYKTASISYTTGVSGIRTYYASGCNWELVGQITKPVRKGVTLSGPGYFSLSDNFYDLNILSRANDAQIAANPSEPPKPQIAFSWNKYPIIPITSVGNEGLIGSFEALGTANYTPPPDINGVQAYPEFWNTTYSFLSMSSTPNLPKFDKPMMRSKEFTKITCGGGETFSHVEGVAIDRSGQIVSYKRCTIDEPQRIGGILEHAFVTFDYSDCYDRVFSTEPSGQFCCQENWSEWTEWTPSCEQICYGEAFTQRRERTDLSGCSPLQEEYLSANGCKTGISYPVSVYRNGGYAGSPGYQATFAGCDPVLVGTLEGPDDTITVSWPAQPVAFSVTRSSVEALAIDNCGNRVYSNNKLIEGQEAAAGASLVINGASLTMNATLQCGGDWCPCP